MIISLRPGRVFSGLCALGILLALLVFAAGCTQQTATPPATTPATAGMPNPASVYCGQTGGILEIKKDAAGGEYGMCTLKNGTSCEEWALFRGEGCKPGMTAAVTTTVAEGKKMVTFTETDNGKIANIMQGTRFAVQLQENLTTGYMWNATVSSGLVIQSSDFSQTPAAAGLVGSGGTRTWVILAKDLGDQKFSASYRRSWEPVTGNETVFLVNVKVVNI
ncbi:MAG: DUF333 domain-containing protein [Methanoregula sp.]|nr:DUF333 domain-containing protein [Methanoregula sp.]